MNNARSFVPSKPEETVNVTITVREANLLTSLRCVSFGKVLVHITNGIITRIEPTVSNLVSDNKEDIDLT